MSIQGQYLHAKKVERKIKRMNHSDHKRLDKEQRENRKARVEYRKKVYAYDSKRAFESVDEA